MKVSFRGHILPQLENLNREYQVAAKDIKDWIFLPFTEHRALMGFKPEHRVSIDSVSATEARQAELIAKKKFIKDMMVYLKSKYKEALVKHKLVEEEFVKNNDALIIGELVK